MDDAVAGLDVGDDDLHGFVQEDVAVFDRDGDRIAGEGGFSALAIEGDYIGSHDLAGDDMVEQDVGQRLEVLGLEQIFDGASRQLGEGLISGCEEGERAFALECVDQTSSLNGGYEGGEATIGDGGINDVFGCGGNCRRNSRCSGRSSRCATSSQNNRSEQQQEQRTNL